jgi:hypothetical protein
MMLSRRRLWSALSACLLAVTLVHAVCLNGHPSVAEEFKAAKAVIVARVVREHDVPEARDGFWNEGKMYTVKIELTFRENLGDEADLFSENTSGRFPMVVGSRYFLFVSRLHDRLIVDYCGNSGLLAKRQKELQEVGRLAAKP